MLESMPLNERTTKGKFLYFNEIDGVKAETDISDAVNQAKQKLEALGFEAVEQTPEAVIKAFEPYVVLAIQASLQIDDILLEAAGTKAKNPSDESPSMQFLRSAVAERLPELTAESLLKAWHAVAYLRSSCAQLFEQFDFVLSPVSAISAPEHGKNSFEVLGKTYEPHEVYRFSSAANVLGLPALAFPVGKNNAGKPIGVQLMGPRFSERLLIEAVRSMGFTQALELSK